MEKTLSVSKLKNNLSSIVNEIAKKKRRFTITRNGKTVAAIVSSEELETLEILADKELMKSLIRAEKDIKNKKLFSHKEVFGEI